MRPNNSIAFHNAVLCILVILHTCEAITNTDKATVQTGIDALKNLTANIKANDFNAFVNTVSNNNIQPRAFAMEAAAAPVADSAPSFSQRSFSDFHLYTLSEPVSLE